MIEHKKPVNDNAADNAALCAAAGWHTPGPASIAALIAVAIVSAWEQGFSLNRRAFENGRDIQEIVSLTGATPGQIMTLWDEALNAAKFMAHLTRLRIPPSPAPREGTEL